MRYTVLTQKAPLRCQLGARRAVRGRPIRWKEHLVKHERAVRSARDPYHGGPTHACCSTPLRGREITAILAGRLGPIAFPIIVAARLMRKPLGRCEQKEVLV
jgi:hypothetical protein